MLWFTLGSTLIGVVLWNYTNPPGSKDAATKKSTSAQPQSTATQFTKEDYSAHFARLNLATSDIFRPLVTTAAGSVTTNNFDIPTEMTKGEANWAFTGTAAINNSQMALFENSKTLQGNYVKIGEHWKTCMLESISGDEVTLRSDSGDTKTIQMTADLQEIAAQTKANTTPPTLVPPFNPAGGGLAGPIGNGVLGGPMAAGPGGPPAAGAPAATGNVTIQAAPAGGPKGGRFNRFNRRNRGS